MSSQALSVRHRKTEVFQLCWAVVLYWRGVRWGTGYQQSTVGQRLWPHQGRWPGCPQACRFIQSLPKCHPGCGSNLEADECQQECPKKHVQSFAHFYFNIEIDPMHWWPNGERIPIAYQARVRWQWHDNIARGQGFNIAPINQKLLSTIAEEVCDAVRVDAIKKVSQYPYSTMTHSNALPSSLPSTPAQTLP